MRPPATSLVPRLDSILQVLLACFAAHRLPRAVESIAVAVEHFGASAPPAIWAGLLAQLIANALVLASTASPALHEAFYKLCHRAVMFCPRGVALLGEFSFIYRYISRESCSQIDSLPLTYLIRSRTSARRSAAPSTTPSQTASPRSRPLRSLR